MHSLFEEVLRRLKGADLQEVYPSFDAVPVSRKSKELFTVLAPESVQLEPAFPNGGTGAYPFSAVYKVSVLLPVTEPLDTAEDFFYETAVPRLETFGCVLCDVKPAHVDAALNRVVMEGRFRLRGVYLAGGAEE